MFTGLIQAVGRVRKSSRGLMVEGCEPFSPLSIGESIAVDGVCLTVAEIFSNGFFADVSEETLKRTTLGLKSGKGDYVNLEPALRLSDRLGGHLVSGHVDGLGEVVSLEELSHSWKIEISWQNSDLGRYICEKGSISLNGISLTVAGFSDDERRFFVAVIPHTWQTTSLKYLRLGMLVNLEVDLLAKYSERLLQATFHSKTNKDSEKKSPSPISLEWLKSQGWS